MDGVAEGWKKNPMLSSQVGPLMAMSHQKGNVYYFPEAGECHGDYGEGGCTWKLLKTRKSLRARCLIDHLTNLAKTRPDFKTLFARCASNDATLCTMKEVSANVSNSTWPVCQGQKLPESSAARYCEGIVAKYVLTLDLGGSLVASSAGLGVWNRAFESGNPDVGGCPDVRGMSYENSGH